MEQVTPKQLTILLLLYRFRFLNRIQIQKLLNHKSPRRINTWLKDLTKRNIVGRKYSNKLLVNTRPAIYCLATKSRKILLTRPNIQEKLLARVYRDKTRSNRLIDHCVFLADIYFYLLEQTKAKKLHFFTKADLATYYYLPSRRPDAYTAIEEKQTIRYFLEIVDEETRRFMLRSKIAQYFDYADSNDWQKNTGHDFPSILIVCPNEITQNFLTRHIAQTLEEEPEEIDFFLTTKEMVRLTNMNVNIWQKADEEE